MVTVTKEMVQAQEQTIWAALWGMRREPSVNSSLEWGLSTSILSVVEDSRLLPSPTAVQMPTSAHAEDQRLLSNFVIWRICSAFILWNKNSISKNFKVLCFCFFVYFKIYNSWKTTVTVVFKIFCIFIFYFLLYSIHCTHLFLYIYISL